MHRETLVALNHGVQMCEGVQHTDLIARMKCTVQQAKAHEWLQPIAVHHVTLVVSDTFNLARVDQSNVKPRDFKCSCNGIRATLYWSLEL